MKIGSRTRQTQTYLDDSDLAICGRLLYPTQETRYQKWRKARADKERKADRIKQVSNDHESKKSIINRMFQRKCSTRITSSNISDGAHSLSPVTNSLAINSSDASIMTLSSSSKQDKCKSYRFPRKQVHPGPRDLEFQVSCLRGYELDEPRQYALIVDQTGERVYKHETNKSRQ